MGTLFSEEMKKTKEKKREKEEKKNSILGEDIQFEVDPPESLFENLSVLFKKTNPPPEKPKKTEEIWKPAIKPITEEPKQSLGPLAEPPHVNTPDPLTPLDQNFITKKEMDDHYKLFLNRIQQQLSTLGGGGEVNIAFLDTPITLVTESSYQVKNKDYYIGVNYEGISTITLPPPTNGKRIVVKDESGKASYKNRHIRMVPLSGSDKIDGKESAIINLDHGSLTFIYREGWRII